MGLKWPIFLIGPLYVTSTWFFEDQKTKHHEDTCPKEIGLPLQIWISTPHSTTNMSVFPIRFWQMFHCGSTNATHDFLFELDLISRKLENMEKKEPNSTHTHTLHILPKTKLEFKKMATQIVSYYSMGLALLLRRSLGQGSWMLLSVCLLVGWLGGWVCILLSLPWNPNPHRSPFSEHSKLRSNGGHSARWARAGAQGGYRRRGMLRPARPCFVLDPIRLGQWELKKTGCDLVL